MKNIRLGVFLLPVLFVVISSAVGCATDHGGGVESADTAQESANTPLRLSVELDDGTVIIGVPLFEKIPIESSFADLKLKLELLNTIKFAEDRKTVTVSFANGAKLDGTLGVKTLKLQARFGRHVIPVDHVVSMEVLPGGSQVADLPKGCVLYFSFDHDELGWVTDRSGKGNHGKVEGSKWVADGRKGGAFQFAGGSQRVEVKDNPVFSLKQTDDKTFSLWWKAQGSAEHKMLLKKYSGGNDGTGFSLLPLPSEMSYYTPSRVHHYAKFKGRISPEEWNHVVAVKEGIVWKIYQNGVECPLSSSRNWPMNFDLTTDLPLEIGGCAAPDQSGYGFEGLIDELMIFSRALSPEEVKQLYEEK